MKKEQCRKHKLTSNIRFEIPIQRNTFFSLKEINSKKAWFQLYLADTQDFMLLQHQYEIIMLYGC